MRKVLFLFLAMLVAAPISRAQQDYKIAPNDILVVEVLGEKDLSKEFRVTGTGKINYWLLGEIEVAGKTTTEVKEMLREQLDKDYLVDPQVAVDVKEYRVREVFVNGAVNRAGAIPITGEQQLTIIGALGRAGGLTPRANKNRIKFTRPGVMEKTFSMDDLASETDTSKIIYLKPGDIIEVADKVL